MSSGTEISSQERIVKILSQYLADSFILYFKTHTFHWNVMGVKFFYLHQMFEKQYGELYLSIDEIAERIRSLGAPAPTTTEQLKNLSHLKESVNIPNDKEMIAALYADHDTISRNLRRWVQEIDGTADAASEDFLVQRLGYHEKTAWMLKSHLSNEV